MKKVRPSDRKSTDDSMRFSFRQRMLFYGSGLIFAVVTYAAGMWAFNHAHLASRVNMSEQILSDPRVLFFIVWAVFCVGVSVIAGSMFQREHQSRLNAENLANTDGLTGLYNHLFFQKRLEEEINRANRYSRKLSLIMLDLDNFKPFNDTWGHLEGDRLLKWFADVLHASVRDHDLVARYGGEEFVILLPETERQAAVAVAQRIVEATKRLSTASMGTEKRVTVSAGVSTYPTHGTTRYKLIMSADTALYHAKEQGKDRVEEYSATGMRAATDSLGRQEKVTDTGTNLDALRNLAAMVYQRCGNTEEYLHTLELYTMALGKAINLSVEELENLRLVAILHDLGKVSMPKALFSKLEPLDENDWADIRAHVGAGVSMLSRIGSNGAIIPSVKHHHERYDGNGYPDGLTGTGIPLYARIVAIADAYASMRSGRPYRKAMTAKHALAELRKCSGTQFDPELIEVFISIAPTIRQSRAA